MKKEDIEKEAMLRFNIGEPTCGIEKFIEGANWRINSVWHDASEKPDIGKEIIVIYPDKSCRVFRQNGVWETLIEVDKFIKWAYIEDLLPANED